jgi:hypothetical protein
MAGRIGHVINRRASRVERANKPELPVHPDIVPVVQGSFRNTGPGERVAPRSESLSLDALDEEVVPVLNTLIHVYVRDVDRVAEEFGVAVDEEGLAGRETALVDPDGNRLRVATRRV